MALYPSEATYNMLEKVFGSDDFQTFHKTIKEKLNIVDIEYELLLENNLCEQDGYTDPSNRAKTSIKENPNRVEWVGLSKAGILELINQQFSRVYGEPFDRIVELVLQFALVHELVHVQQFKKGILTKAYLTEIQNTPYEQREIEIEANTIAKEILITSEFDRRILSIMLSDELIDNDNRFEIMNLYDDKTK